jgi:hypothetical protein
MKGLLVPDALPLRPMQQCFGPIAQATVIRLCCSKGPVFPLANQITDMCFVPYARYLF